MEVEGFGGERVSRTGGGSLPDIDRAGKWTGGPGRVVWCWMKVASSMLSSSYASISYQDQNDTSRNSENHL